MEAAGEEVSGEVSGNGDEERVGLLRLHGAERGFEKSGRCVDAVGRAGALERCEVVGLGGRGRSVEDGGPAGCGGGEELGELGGVVEGIEVDVREQEDGNGGGSERPCNIRVSRVVLGGVGLGFSGSRCEPEDGERRDDEENDTMELQNGTSMMGVRDADASVSGIVLMKVYRCAGWIQRERE